MKKSRLIAFGILLIVAFVWVRYKTGQKAAYSHISGQTMGTIVYNVKYGGTHVQKEGIDSVLVELNQALSTYIPDSEISRLNDNGEVVFKSGFFAPVLTTSRRIFKNTLGAFDPTVGPLIKAWGFGPGKKIPDLDSAYVDSLKSYTGFDKVEFDENSAIVPANLQLDFGAIAKGYAVDLVGEYLEKMKITDYLVEIGGEVRCRGKNEKGETWSLGIEDPLVERTEQRLLAIVRLKDRALATSGNYRNYYKKDGRLFAHIIDPRTGYTADHNLLSASVFAGDCMTADAYSTAFMVLGLDASIEIIERVSDLEAVLVYQDSEGKLRSYVSKGIEPFLEMNLAK